MGIALAANIGGQSSPISSPQNLIALEYMDPRLDWGSWFAVALPVSAISIIVIWLMLLVSYRPSRSPDGEDDLQVRGVRPTRESFTLKQYWVTFVCLVTIVLWIIEKQIEDYVGDMGIIAIIPIIAFFSTGVLRKVCDVPGPIDSISSSIFRMISNNSCGLLYSLQWVELLLGRASHHPVYATSLEN